MAIGLALFIVFGFAQFALRGMVDVPKVPWWVHAHGVAMLAWLGLLIVQPRLIARGDHAKHRLLGWAGAGLAATIVVLACFVGAASVAMGRQPPFFSPPYFLALVWIEAIVFGTLVALAIQRRRATDWHRRLMIGATIIILEPALGRLLPMPLMVGWSDLPIAALQLGVVGLIAMHDRKTIGSIHPATKWVAVAIVATRVAVPLIAMAPPLIAAAAQLAA